MPALWNVLELDVLFLDLMFGVMDDKLYLSSLALSVSLACRFFKESFLDLSLHFLRVSVKYVLHNVVKNEGMHHNTAFGSFIIKML